MSILSIGVIGCGNRGTYGHIELLKTFPNVKIIAICDKYKKNIDRAQSLINYPVNTYYNGEEDYINMLKNENIDAVIIATPWQFHTKMAIDAMNNGIIAGVEVPIATTLDECWALIKTYEKTKVGCMMLENVCYREDLLTILNMARLSLFGELLYCHGGYQHDLRDPLLSNYYLDHWRITQNKYRNGDLYPTHSLGPISQMLNINCGNRITKLSSYATKSIGLNMLSLENTDKYQHTPYFSQTYAHGDIITTILETSNGQNIVLIHNTTTARPYSLGFRVQGTNGLWMNDGDLIYLEKNPIDILKKRIGLLPQKVQYLKYRCDSTVKKTEGFYIPHKTIFSVFNANVIFRITNICQSGDSFNSQCPLKIGNLYIGEGSSNNSLILNFRDGANTYTITFTHPLIPINTYVERTIKIIIKDNIRYVSLWINNVLTQTKTVNFIKTFYNDDSGIYVGGSYVNNWTFTGFLDSVEIAEGDLNIETMDKMESDYFNPSTDIVSVVNQENWDTFAKYLSGYRHPLYVKYLNTHNNNFHGGMDWYMMNAFLDAIQKKIDLPIDIYDSVTWSIVSVLSEESIKKGNVSVDFPDFTNGDWFYRKPKFEQCDYVDVSNIHQHDKNIFYSLIENPNLISKSDVTFYENTKKLSLSQTTNLTPGQYFIRKINDLVTVLKFDSTNQCINLPKIANTKAISFWLFIDFTNRDDWRRWAYIMDGREGETNSYVAVSAYRTRIGTNISKLNISGVVYSDDTSINSIGNKWVYVYIEFKNPITDNINLMSKYTYDENLTGMITLISVWNKSLTDLDIINARTGQDNLSGTLSFYNPSISEPSNYLLDSKNVSPKAQVIGSVKWIKFVHPNKLTTISSLNGTKHFVVLFSPVDIGTDPRFNDKYYYIY